MSFLNESESYGSGLQDLVIKDINKDLFQDYIGKRDNHGSDDTVSKESGVLQGHGAISAFLMENNLQYMMLDELVDEMGRLMEDNQNDALCEIEEEVIPDYMQLTRLNGSEGNDSNSSMLLHELYMDITAFSNKISNHQENSIQKTKELVQATVQHLQKIDHLIMLNQSHAYIHQLIGFLQKQNLAGLVVSDNNTASIQLFYHYFQIIQHTRKLLYKTRHCHSKFLNAMRDLFENEVLVSFNTLLENLLLDFDLKGNSTELNSVVFTILKSHFEETSFHSSSLSLSPVIN